MGMREGAGQDSNPTGETTYRIRLLFVKNDTIEATGTGMAILLGLSLDEVAAVTGGVDIFDANDLPTEFKHLGRQRASEAKARADSENPVDIMAYWALQRWGTRVSFSVDPDLATGGLWLVTNDRDVVAEATVGGLELIDNELGQADPT